MIAFINSWTSGIVVSVIIGSILEMILPENNNKKYIKTVIGLFVLFCIISPVIAEFSNGIDLSSISKYEEYMQTSVQPISNNTSIINNGDVEKVYKEKMQDDIKTNLKQLGFETTYINLSINTGELNYGEINEITLKVALNENNITNVKKIEINVSNEVIEEDEISQDDKTKIIDYLNANYNIPKDKIHIN